AGPGPPTPETDYPESLTSYPEEDYSPVGSFSEPRSASPLATPPGWSCHVSPEGQTLYTNHFTQEQVPVPAPRSICKSSQDSETPAQASPPEEKVKERACLGEVGSREEISPAGVGIKTLDKAGVLHRTKTVDKGKRLRKKHWSTSWTVLEGGILTFFKDSKASAAGGLRQPLKLSTPEYTVDLRGASLSWAPKDKSSRKNVLELRSRDGSEYLIQHDSEAIISTWHKAIGEGIQELSADLPPEEESESSNADFGSRERLGSWLEGEARPTAGAVIEHGDQNRMSVQSVAIVFGPTLLRPETEETSMPTTMVFQSQVVELILQRCSDIFRPH
uniref:PH domain-containing protein n=1 Tax=Panthera tigris altaica TaxID=74533 RepID=A0A8C9M2T3_PANTA